ncbi:hypothetical protein EYC08_05420 [Tabrizicola sp. WMC-M-20]|nr:hypothetical protein EYC08_05420 [Tabrizicola sp. WMC-M-20]
MRNAAMQNPHGLTSQKRHYLQHLRANFERLVKQTLSFRAKIATVLQGQAKGKQSWVYRAKR